MDNRCGQLKSLLEAYYTLEINIDIGKDVAIKLKYVFIDFFLLEGESDIYRSLSDGVGILRVYAYKTKCEYNVMVFNLLGPSLKDLFNFCRRKFSLKTVLILADQLIRYLEYMHLSVLFIEISNLRTS